MKKARILLPFFLFASNISFSQIDIDSLVNNLKYSKKFQIVDSIQYLTQYFKRFESDDGKEIYDVFLDSGEKIGEYIGLSVVYKQYDSECRNIKIIGYDREGNYDYWDYEPIQITTYLKDSVIVDLYNRFNSFSSRSIKISDFKSRQVESLEFDKDLKLYLKTVFKYIDSSNELLIMTYDGLGLLQPNTEGVTTHYEKFDPGDNDFIKEERFYGSTNNLINANHLIKLGANSFSSIGIDFSTLRRTKLNGEITVSYYDSNGKLVYIEWDE